MALARAEEGGGRQNIDLHALIQLIHTHHVSQHPQITLSGQAAHILGNTSQIESVLNNLIQNALRYGAPPLQIHAFQNAQNTGFSVSDAGPGISEANQAKIFDRFFTTARAAGGTGLGLALVRTICIAHGGQVTVESRPGYTCFTVSFPRNDL
jgi:two-component system OmpR family sensor kinase